MIKCILCHYVKLKDELAKYIEYMPSRIQALIQASGMEHQVFIIPWYWYCLTCAWKELKNYIQVN